MKPKTTWQLLKPHVNMIIQTFAFPLFCFSEQDAEAFEDDPIDYIRSQLDVFEEATLPAGSAGMFIESVISKRKPTFLPQLEFVQNVMQANALGQGRTAQEKEGAMRLASALTVMMINSPQTSKQLDQFFATFIIPELKSPHNFLRFRACDLIKTFDKRGMEWQNASTLEAAFRGVMDCLLDKDLPVRVQAAAALGELIAHDEIRDVMAPNAGRLMQELLKLSDETDLDVLMVTQEKVVETFSEELIPFAVELTTQLRDSYVRMVHELAAAAAQAEQSNGEVDFGEKSAEDKSESRPGLNSAYDSASTLLKKFVFVAHISDHTQCSLRWVISLPCTR